MSKLNLSSLSINDLWALHEEVSAVLSERITAEKRRLEQQLAKLSAGFPLDDAVGRKVRLAQARGGRRHYPPVLPKYQNPKDPSETWAGRGKQPRWLISQLKAGKKIDDFLIDRIKRQTMAKGPSVIK